MCTARSSLTFRRSPWLVKPGAELNALPGFSSVSPAVETATNGATNNVAAEDNDERSVLNFYRHLIAIHHGNWSVRNGTQYTLDHDFHNTLLWLRRAPAGTRTSATIVVACNLSERPVEISLTDDFVRLHLRGGTLRPLLTTAENALPLATTDYLSLPPFTIFLGELYHDGEAAPAEGAEVRRRRRPRIGGSDARLSSGGSGNPHLMERDVGHPG